jgi:hypothetical protein
MTVDPMASAWAKYHWASKHMDSVNAAIGRSIDPNLHTVALKVDLESQPTRAIAMVRIENLPTIRTDLGLALGDVIQNFRAALDHLAWGLVKIGTKPRPSYPEGVYFPIAKSRVRFDRKIDEWLPGVPDEHRAITRRYQPYRRGDGPKAIRWLVRLSNTDKHRVLIPAVMNQSRLNLDIASNWSVLSLEWLVEQPRALHIGTPVLRIDLRRTGAADCQVQVDGQGTLYPSLGRGVPLLYALVLIRRTVFEILGTFDKML